MRKQTLTVSAAMLVSAAFIMPAQAQQTTAPRTGSQAAAPAPAKTAEADLQRASQKLRDALAVLEKEAPGANRDRAMKAVREALNDTHDTMARLQAEAKFAPSRGTSASVGSTGRPSPAEAMKRLHSATDTLYDAVHALAKLSPDTNRNEAIKKADEALFETEQAAMLSELDWKLPSAHSK